MPKLPPKHLLYRNIGGIPFGVRTMPRVLGEFFGLGAPPELRVQSRVFRAKR